MTLRDLMAPVLRGDLYYATRPRRPRLAVDPSGVARDMRSDAEAAAWAVRRAVPLSWIHEGATVLDVGCGDGKLRLARPDLTVYGYEPDAEDWSEAQKRGVLEATDVVASDIDVVFLMDVVEHMADPFTDLTRGLRWIRSGALVIVECPDFWCPMAQLYGDRFRLLHDPDHVSLFTAESLVRMLRDLGVMIEDVAFPFYGGPYDTAATWEQHEMRPEHVSPPSPGNMVAVRGRKR